MRRAQRHSGTAARHAQQHSGTSRAAAQRHVTHRGTHSTLTRPPLGSFFSRGHWTQCVQCLLPPLGLWPVQSAAGLFRGVVEVRQRRVVGRS